jgi:leucyl/phenylalanyl-tRNA---protein transferase
MQVQAITPENILNAYAQGAFPMADEMGVVRWYSADPRGVLPLDQFHMPRSLQQKIRRGQFDIKVNASFKDVMFACSQRRHDGTWISMELIDNYCRLHEMGYAHSVETWIDGKLAGGLYGVAMGGVFFGESMFYREADASKIALWALVNRLRDRKYAILDTQAVTRHLVRFGAIEIPAREYLGRLQAALQLDRTFD